MRAAVAAQYKFRRVGTALAMHSSLARAQLPLPISRTISCHRCQLFAEIETDSCAGSPTAGIPLTSPFAAHSPSRVRSGGTAAPSSSVAMALASLCRSPVVHCTRMRAAVAAQYKLRLVGAAFAMHSSLARAQSSLPIARAILCHRCHLSAGIETASHARSTPMASPFTANARRRDADARTEHMHSQFATRCRRSQGSSRAVTFRQEGDQVRASLHLIGPDDGAERTSNDPDV